MLCFVSKLVSIIIKTLFKIFPFVGLYLFTSRVYFLGYIYYVTKVHNIFLKPGNLFECQCCSSLIMSIPRGRLTYCFTAFIVSVCVNVSISVRVRSHPKAPLLDFSLGAPKYDPSYIEIIFHW